jgi:NAD(P)H-dependent flavin oxidoreductase YrpB (nitropropane dioxygenase family)
VWSDRRVIDLVGIEHPILLSPMANAGTVELAIAVADAGALGALPCAALSSEQIRASLEIIRQRTARPINLNFFCHAPPSYDAARDARWKARLARYYAELGIDPNVTLTAAPSPPFNEAAGGIADGRGIAAALMLGASAVQIGTAYLLCPESGLKPIQSEALRNSRDDSTALINVFTGRPARGKVNRFARELGLIDPEVPAFPLPAAHLAPLRSKAEVEGLADFAYVLLGQSAALSRNIPARELTRTLAADALGRLSGRK